MEAKNQGWQKDEAAQAPDGAALITLYCLLLLFFHKKEETYIHRVTLPWSPSLAGRQRSLFYFHISGTRCSTSVEHQIKVLVHGSSRFQFHISGTLDQGRLNESRAYHQRINYIISESCFFGHRTPLNLVALLLTYSLSSSCWDLFLFREAHPFHFFPLFSIWSS